MSQVATQYAHIVVGDDSVPRIEGTTTKVIEIVLDQKVFGWTAEEIYLQHDYLSLGQIYSALAYYWDHKDELDADIERRREYVEQLKSNAPPSPVLQKLKARGLR